MLLVSVLFVSSTHTNEKEKIASLFNEKYHVFGIKLPDQISFADEQFPSEINEYNTNLKQELFYLLINKNGVTSLFNRSKKMLNEIENELIKNNIPADLKYLALVESNCTNVISAKGTSGIWQFSENTAKAYGLTINDSIDERLNYPIATKAACMYFSDSYNSFKNWTLAAASFNLGISGLKQNMEIQKCNDYYRLKQNSITDRYIYKALAYKIVFENPEKFGISIK